MIVKDTTMMSSLSQWCCYLLLIIIASGCHETPETWEDFNDEGTFLIYRRQSLIGEENYNITSAKNSIVVTSLQGENERGRISGVQAELQLNKSLSPLSYFSRRIVGEDTTNIFKMALSGDEVSIWEKHFEVATHKAPDTFFPLHSNIPAAMEMMLYHYYFNVGQAEHIPTLPRGNVTITYKGQDIAQIKGESIPLDRYVVEGINWGGRTIWLDADKNLIAIVKANTQIREIIKQGYEEAMPIFIKGNVTEQINQLTAYTEANQGIQADVMALVGADIINGLSDLTQQDMTMIIENGKITAIEKSGTIDIPAGATEINLAGKTLMPGLWDMHAHSNQVQWAPAYLAGGVTTVRDNGNEVEFATAFRDAIDQDNLLGPDILLAGMTDGPGDKGNGIIRATHAEEAREVVEMYHSKGYKQVKIYNSIQPEVLKVLAEEGHKKGMSVTGHIPNDVGTIVDAVQLGMDMFSHDRAIFSVLYPEKTKLQAGADLLENPAIDPDRVNRAIRFLLENKIALLTAINQLSV